MYRFSGVPAVFCADRTSRRSHLDISCLARQIQKQMREAFLNDDVAEQEDLDSVEHYKTNRKCTSYSRPLVDDVS